MLEKWFKQKNKENWNGFENILQRRTLQNHDLRLACSEQWRGLEKENVNLFKNEMKTTK